MTFRPTTWPTTSKALACLAVLAISACHGAQPDIPSRVERAYGRFVLSSQTEVVVSQVSAGPWARRRLTLEHNGQAVWQSPLVTATITPYRKGSPEELKYLRVDVDGNGKPDWVYLAFARRFRSYNEGSNDKRVFDDAESVKELSQPWNSVLCGWLSGMIVLDDEKTVYVFDYSEVPDPFMHSNPYVQGEVHYKAVVLHGSERHDQLQVASPIPASVWSSVQKIIETHACNTPDEIDKRVRAEKSRIKWNALPLPFAGPDWRANLADGLAMYQRAHDLYVESQPRIPKESRMTKDALGVFRFDAFFEVFPYDEIDPENKYPAYTAMLNDYAFYQMAPGNADEAVGFDNRRKPVGEGVIAVLAHVIRRDPKRTVAYLNLGDALWRNQRDAEAAWYYTRYLELQRASNPKARPPQRAVERAKIS